MVLDGFLLFLIILMLKETAKDGSESHDAKVILGTNNGSETKTVNLQSCFKSMAFQNNFQLVGRGV